MKWFMRGLSVQLLCVGMLGVLGCGPDNDTEANSLSKAAGSPGTPDAKGVPKTQEAPPKTQAEYGQRQKERQGDMFKGGYGGTKK